MKELTFIDAIPLIERIPDHEKLTLIGGQAICFWYEYYAEKYGDLFDENMLIIRLKISIFLATKTS